LLNFINNHWKEYVYLLNLFSMYFKWHALTCSYKMQRWFSFWRRRRRDVQIKEWTEMLGIIGNPHHWQWLWLRLAHIFLTCSIDNRKESERTNVAKDLLNFLFLDKHSLTFFSWYSYISILKQIQWEIGAKFRLNIPCEY
jgi:hypothetical protein